MLDDITLTKKGKVVFGSLFLMLVIPVIVYGFSLSENRKEDFTSLMGGQVLDAKDASTDLIYQNVSEIMELPQGEVPRIAYLSDISKLSSKTLFKNAQNGDYLLIFETSRRVILYRPSTNKIIDVVNAVLPTSQPAPTQAKTLLPTFTPSPTDVVEVEGDDSQSVSSESATLTPTPAL